MQKHSKYMLVFIVFLLIFGHSISALADTSTKFSENEIKAKAAVLMDENGVILFEKNSHEALPPASVTKTMTILLAVEAVESGRVKLSDLVTASENAWRQGGSQIWLKKGEVLRFDEMLTALAVASANDAAVALMEHIYGSETAAVAAMNQRAGELGLLDTHFVNVNGLPAEKHYMSAYDTAVIVREALHHPLYMQVCGIKEYWLRDGKNWLINTNKLLWWYKGADGLKTGWTETAKYCFAGTAERDGLRLIAVVFAAPEPRLHFKEAMKLFDWGFANFKANKVVNKDELVGHLEVMKGDQQDVGLIATDSLNIILEKEQTKKIDKQVIAEAVTAPVEMGKIYGELIVSIDGKECGRVTLAAEHSVEKAGFIAVLKSAFLQLIKL